MFDNTNRHALISELAKRTAGNGYNLGKTALQKHLYFLDALYGVDAGYSFRLYNYGPFSSEILSDLDTVEFMDGVKISYDSSVGGYRIRPGRNADGVSDAAKEFIEESSEAIDAVLKDFGNLNAKELELRATIVYAERETKEDGRQIDEEELAQIVHDIKPHFSVDLILDVIEQLKDKGHIELRV